MLSVPSVRPTVQRLRGQGPRGYGSAGRRRPACESREAVLIFRTCSAGGPKAGRASFYGELGPDPTEVEVKMAYLMDAPSPTPIRPLIA